jgi:hypothetical protein
VFRSSCRENLVRPGVAALIVSGDRPAPAPAPAPSGGLLLAEGHCALRAAHWRQGAALWPLPVDGADTPFPSGTVFAGTTAGAAADLFAGEGAAPAEGSGRTSSVPAAPVVPLGHRHDGLQMHVQPQAQPGPRRIDDRREQGLLGRHCGLADGGGGGLSRGCHEGSEQICFHQPTLGPVGQVPQPFMASNSSVRHGTCFRRHLSAHHAGAAPHSAVAELGVVRRHEHPRLQDSLHSVCLCARNAGLRQA